MQKLKRKITNQKYTDSVKVSALFKYLSEYWIKEKQ